MDVATVRGGDLAGPFAIYCYCPFYCFVCYSGIAPLALTRDFIGPLVFLLCFGLALLLKGKAQFGFIYGLGMMGCGSIWLLLNLMSHDIDLATSTSILGYCLLPMVAVAYLSLIFKGLILTILVTLSIALCTWRATSMFVSLFRSRRTYLFTSFSFCHTSHIRLFFAVRTAMRQQTRNTSLPIPLPCSISRSLC
jgi:hypothetical protein